MTIVYILVPASLVLALVALLGYMWCVGSGQFEDLDTPPRRMLNDDPD